MESGRQRETTAASHGEVVSKGSDLVARLFQGLPGPDPRRRALAHYPDPLAGRFRGRAWSARHREEQEAQCARS